MINIYDCINSEDIRTHLRNIEYTFSPVECAYIVGLSEKINLNEKKTAFKEIIRTMPDCIVGGESLHTFLKQLIESEKDPIMNFRDQSNFEFFFSATPLIFPLPFQKGDILVQCIGEVKNPFVFLGEYVDDVNGYKQSGYISGYCYSNWNSCISLYCEIALNCKFYDFEEVEDTSIHDEKKSVSLVLLSAYLKGEIDEEMFRNQYKQLAQKIADTELDEFFKK